MAIRHALLCVATLGLLAGFVAVRVPGPLSRAAGGDAPFYTGLAESMIHGRGYVLDRSPWPGQPHLSRLPVWPALIAAGMMVASGASEYAVMRGTGVVVHATVAVLIALLAYQLWRRPWAALLAGAAYALYPSSLYLIQEGDSEPAFVVTAVAGLLLILRFESVRAQIAGAFLSGLAVLTRSNYIILPIMVVFAALLRRGVSRRYWTRFLILTAAFLTFPFLWMLRNYAVSGAFPLLSALEGETLYGANNEVSATDLGYWGYWVFPDLIPGETPKKQLGKRLSEKELNTYYHTRAILYVKANWFVYPRLILGKLVRGFVPVPWRPTVSTYLADACRLVLYLAFLWYTLRGIIPGEFFKIYLLAMFLVLLLTTVVFYGTGRFSFLLEVFLIPCVAAGFSQDFGKWYARRKYKPAEDAATSQN